jgi:hypothetical protein
VYNKEPRPAGHFIELPGEQNGSNKQDATIGYRRALQHMNFSVGQGYNNPTTWMRIHVN